jgi:hypothetical protein
LPNVHLACKECAAGAHTVAAGMASRRLSRTRSDDVDKIARSLVSRIYEDVLHESCVLFMGSGCTTEGRGLHSSNFYDEIKEKSGYPSSTQPPSFPDLMEYFCQHMDGGQHNRLIREAVSRIERFCVPGDENYSARVG